MKKFTLIGLSASLFLSASCFADDVEKQKSFLSFDIPKGFNAELSEEDSEASLGLNYVMPDQMIGVSFTGKIDDGEGEFVGLDGISSDAKVTGTYSYFIADLGGASNPPSLTFDEKVVDMARFALRECKLLNASITGLGETPVDNCEKETQLVDELSDSLTHSADETLSISRLANDINKKCDDYAKKPWAGRFELEEICKSRKELNDALRKGTDNDNYALTEFGVFSVSGSYLQNKFEWIDVDAISTDDKTNDSTKDGFEFAISYAHIDALDLFKWEFGAKYEKGYSNASSNKERELCFDYSSEQQITECIKGFLLPPVKTEAISPFASLTKQFSNESLIKSIGLDIKYTFDDKEDQNGEDAGLDRWTVEIPVHLVTVLDDKLSAGIKLSWVSEVKAKEDPIKLSLFVSVPLTVFGTQ